MESALPIDVHREHFVRSVSVVKEGLQENGAKPVRREKTQYDHFEKVCILQGTVIYWGHASVSAKGGGLKNLLAAVCFRIRRQLLFFTPPKQILNVQFFLQTRFRFVFEKQVFIKFHKKII